jgi:hypothetical protein
MKTAVEWLAEQVNTAKWKFADKTDREDIINQAKEMEKEQKYSIDFIMWYSGMDKEKIENAHKRWYNETFKSE